MQTTHQQVEAVCYFLYNLIAVWKSVTRPNLFSNHYVFAYRKAVLILLFETALWSLLLGLLSMSTARRLVSLLLDIRVTFFSFDEIVSLVIFSLNSLYLVARAHINVAHPVLVNLALDGRIFYVVRFTLRQVVLLGTKN